MAADTQLTITEQQRLANLETAVFGGSNPAGGVATAVVATAPVSSGLQTVAGPVKTQGYVDTPVVYSGTQDALAYPGSAVFSSTVVDAATLATPTAGTDDGKQLAIYDAGGASHTVTTASGKILSGSTQAHKTLTFNGNAGASILLEAYQGFWYVRAMSVSPYGVTIS